MSKAEKRLFDDSRAHVATHYNGLLYRNNSGALPDKEKNLVRFGLGNDSKQLNEIWKSPDSVGGIPITITPDMVGRTFLVLCGFEDKKPGWTLRPSDARGHAQNNCLQDWRQAGGIAGFITDVSHIDYYVQEFIRHGKK